MDTSHTSRAAIAAVTALLAVAAAGCGGGSSAAPSASQQDVSTVAARTCDTSRPIAYLFGAAFSDGRAALSAKVKDGAGASWSPDGTVEAYVSANARKVILRSAGGASRTLFDTPRNISIVHKIAWSPDGQRLALLVEVPDLTHLVVIDADTGRPVRDVPLSTSVVSLPLMMNPMDALAFSPDGTRVLVSWESPAVVDVGSGQVHRLWHAPAVAGWTPEGNVLFLDVINRARFGALRLWSPGSPERIIWKPGMVASQGITAEHGIEYGQLLVSPDGTHVAIRTTNGGKTAIDVFRLSGSTPGGKVGSYPVNGRIWDADWSPDSGCLAAVVLDGERLDVRTLNIGTGAWKPVGRIPVKVTSFDMPDALGTLGKLSWNG